MMNRALVRCRREFVDGLALFAAVFASHRDQVRWLL